MLTHTSTWSHAGGNEVVPSPWQPTRDVSSAVALLQAGDQESSWVSRSMNSSAMWNCCLSLMRLSFA